MLEINFQPFPNLFLQHYTLRQVTAEDAIEIFAMRSQPEVMKYLDRAPATSIDDAIKLINTYTDLLAKNEAINWAICLKDNPCLIGNICLWQIQKDNHRAEVGYMLHPSYFRKGIMKAVIPAIIDYGFNTLHLHSIEANVNPANTASIKLLELFGFVREAYFRENYYYNGNFLDSAIYSLLHNPQKG